MGKCLGFRCRRVQQDDYDEVVLKELRDISHKTGIKQPELIAEGLNYGTMC
jgi:hypothetical protein